MRATSVVGCYAEGDRPPSFVYGVIVGGFHGNGFALDSPHRGESIGDSAGSATGNWKNIWITDRRHPKRVGHSLDMQDETHGFNACFSDDAPATAILMDQYEGGNGHVYQVTAVDPAQADLNGYGRTPLLADL